MTVNPELDRIMQRTKEVDTQYAKDRQKLSSEAFDLLMDGEAGVTQHRDLFLLAIHGISLYGENTTQEEEIIAKYNEISDFAHASVDAALANIREDLHSYPQTSYIEEIMYVPHVQSPCNDRPNLRYRARQSRSPRSGWIEIGVAGRKTFSPNESVPRTDLSGGLYRALAYVEGYATSHDRFDDFTSTFTVGFQAIYDKRPNIVNIDHRRAEQVFTSIIDSAIKEYPDNIR